MYDRFIRTPVNIQTEVGEFSGVLAAVGEVRPGGWRLLLLYNFQGQWVLVRTWVALKTARSGV